MTKKQKQEIQLAKEAATFANMVLAFMQTRANIGKLTTYKQAVIVVTALVTK